MRPTVPQYRELRLQIPVPFHRRGEWLSGTCAHLGRAQHAPIGRYAARSGLEGTESPFVSLWELHLTEELALVCSMPWPHASVAAPVTACHLASAQTFLSRQ